MTKYSTASYPASRLMSEIQMGKVYLPESQRPFVWDSSNICQFIDSLYRGYPVGSLLIWEMRESPEQIQNSNEQSVGIKFSVIDGQQRLMSLYALINGEKILRSNGKLEKVRISFDPFEEKFAVANASTAKDKSLIPDISEMWQSGLEEFSITENFLEQISTTRQVSSDDRLKIFNSIRKLRNIPDSYLFSVIVLNPSLDISTVADIYVRINSEGKAQTHTDFIMFLMSVYWAEGKRNVQNFVEKVSKPIEKQIEGSLVLVKPTVTQLLLATIGLSLKRARLENIYNVFPHHAIDSEYEDYGKRIDLFRELKFGQGAVLNSDNWYGFLEAISASGFRDESMISPEYIVIFSYILYLIGVEDFGIKKERMKQVIAMFFFMASLTARYSKSAATTFETDLANFKGIESGDLYCKKLQELCESELTRKFWSDTLPELISTSTTRSPIYFAYCASLIKLDASTLLGDEKIATIFTANSSNSNLNSGCKHLFSKNYLESKGITELEKLNSIANMAFISRSRNARSILNPSEIDSEIENSLTAKKSKQVKFYHAIPKDWTNLEFNEFLTKRQKLIAKVIKEAWQKISKPVSESEKVENVPITKRYNKPTEHFPNYVNL